MECGLAQEEADYVAAADDVLALVVRGSQKQLQSLVALRDLCFDPSFSPAGSPPGVVARCVVLDGVASWSLLALTR